MATRKKAPAPAPEPPAKPARKASKPAPAPPAAKKPARTRSAPVKKAPTLPEITVKRVNPGKEAMLMLTGSEPAPVAAPPIEIIELGLTPTSVPGVYKNKVGVLVDGDGVMIDHSTLKNRDQERFEKIIGGPVDTPAKLLKAVALDPQLPLQTRIGAATSAAPYFDRKKPIGIDGGEDGKAITVEHIHKIQGMSRDELDQLERLLAMGAPGLLGTEGENAESDD